VANLGLGRLGDCLSEATTSRHDLPGVQKRIAARGDPETPAWITVSDPSGFAKDSMVLNVCASARPDALSNGARA